MVGVRAPISASAPNWVGRQSTPPRSTRRRASPRGGRRDQASRRSDRFAPTASIAQPPSKSVGLNLAPESGPAEADLMAAIPPGIPASLRDATAAGQPNAQYELATRLFEGRGVPKDQPAAARWFERAASARPCSGAVSAWLDVREGHRREPRSGGRKTLVLKAAQAGNARAAHNLAVMRRLAPARRAELSRSGEMVPKSRRTWRPRQPIQSGDPLCARARRRKDLGQAWLWFSLAAQEGDADAGKKRDEMAREMDPLRWPPQLKR